MPQVLTTLTKNEKESIEQILSAAGGEAANQVLKWVDRWKRKNGLEGDVFIGADGKVFTSETAKEAEARQKAEILKIQEAQKAAKENRNLIIGVVALIAITGVGYYLINKN